MPIKEYEWESLEYEHEPLLKALENQLQEGFPQAYTLEELANELRIVEEVDAEPDLFYPVARSKSNHQTERPGLNLDSISRVGETMERFLIEMAEPADRSA